MKIKRTTLIICTALLIKLIIVVCIYGTGSDLASHVIFDKDEARYLDLSGRLLTGLTYRNFDSVLSDYYYYTQSYHVGNYFFLAFVRMAFGDSYIALVTIKGIMYGLGTYFFSEWILGRYGARAAIFATIALCVYVPLQFLSLSIMRDDIIFSGMAYTVYMIDKRRLVLAGSGIVFTALFRINASMSLFAYQAMRVIRKESFKKHLMKLMFAGSVLLLAVIAVLLRFEYIRSRIFELLGGFSAQTFAVGILRFMISPLPWSIDQDLPLILRLWYTPSFFISIIVSLYFAFECLTRRLRADYALLTFLVTSIIPYILIENLGFRQVAPIMPFVAIPILVRMLGLRKLDQNLGIA